MADFPETRPPVKTMTGEPLSLPRLVFGTSSLGNLYAAVGDEVKREIVGEILARTDGFVAFDSAGKYGAGLALESLGAILRERGAAEDRLVISNKLGWRRMPLAGPEPTFERGVWFGLSHDARQDIGYEGILRCYEEGNDLLGSPYCASLVSVHDPDEYLARAGNAAEVAWAWEDILGAYRALGELKASGRVRAVGVGSKDWRVIERLADEVPLDWAMLACSFTIHSHPAEVVSFIERLRRDGIPVINSAVFHAGFLVGGDFYDYRRPEIAADAALFSWRERFFAVCRRFSVEPAAACVAFGLSAPGIASIALNTSKPGHVAKNLAMVSTPMPEGFWDACRDAGLIRRDYPYVQ